MFRFRIPWAFINRPPTAARITNGISMRTSTPTSALRDRSKVHVGFEMLGMPQRDVTPESAAAHLKSLCSQQ